MTKKRPRSARPKASIADLDAAVDALERLARDPKLISGIYNYCDRWCERCPLTRRCLVFKTEEARATQRSGRATRTDRDNEAFWDDVSQSFAVTLHMIRRDAKKHGIDPDAADVRAEGVREERTRARRAARQGSALHRAATAYWKATKALLDELPPEIAETENTLNMQVRLGTGAPQAEAQQIRDALEVVQWYQYFIDVKLQRAVASRVDREREGDDGFPSDADGSAKIALVAIDRSIGAWAQLRERLDASGDAILDLLVRLERLRHAVESEFPHARAFKRPGFDDVLIA